MHQAELLNNTENVDPLKVQELFCGIRNIVRFDGDYTPYKKYKLCDGTQIPGLYKFGNVIYTTISKGLTEIILTDNIEILWIYKTRFEPSEFILNKGTFEDLENILVMLKLIRGD